ncbi:MAG: D-alanine-D-alanine ligase [Chloroflexi bacterium]|nr:MAG: D-alanine-D-alanine ligase [Chloroflexota bacterium]MBA4375300.1 D-alanine--D-alanine ligase A [Anaerolinea sp.]
MSEKMKIAVIFGGRSGEHEVSLMSARSVLSVLSPEKFEITQIGITHSGAWLTGKNVIEAFESNSFDHLLPVVLLPEPRKGSLYVLKGNVLESLPQMDVVFPVLHGTFGEDGTMQGLFELADVAYVGCGVLSSAVGMDKNLFKDVMRANNIPVVESVLLTRSQISSSMDKVISNIENTCPYPVFVKPANLGSSVGISKCTSRSDLMEGLMEAARFDRRVLVERGINAREIEVSVLGNENPIASIAGEIRPMDEFYTYEAKYLDDTSELIIPARLDETTMTKLQQIAIQAFQVIDGAGMARVDFLLDRDTNEIYLSEVNTIPGFTKISMYPKLWGASGISYPDLVDRLISLALQRKQDRDNTERSFRRNE